MKKIFTFLMASFIGGTVIAQVPQYTSQNGTSNNVYPWGNTSINKVQWIFFPADFTPSITAGLITKIYIMMNPSTGSAGTKTYTNFKIGLTNTTATAIGTGLPWFPVTYVYDAPSVTFTQVMGQWIEIPLQTPFFYDGTSNIIFEGSQTSYTSGGISVVHNSQNGNRRMWGTTTGTTSTGSGTGCLYWGFDMVKENDLTPTKLVSPNLDNLCSGYNEIKVRVKNLGIIDIQSFNVNWSVDNVLQPQVSVTNVLGSYGNLDSMDVSLGGLDLPLNVNKTLKIWTSDPNSVNDPNPSNDTLTINLMPTRQGISIQPIPDTTLCMGKELVIDAGYNPNTDYTWSNGDQTQQARFRTTGEHWLFAYSTDGCMHRDTFIITEHPQPTAAPIVSAIDNGQGNFIFNISSASDIDYYEWNFGDGSPLEYGPGPKPHTYQNYDEYTVTLRLGNKCDTIVRQLHLVNQDLNIKNLVFDKHLNIFPIPLNSDINIEAKNNELIESVTLINSLGQVIIQQNVKDVKAKIDIHALASGQYIIRVRMNDQDYYKSVIK